MPKSTNNNTEQRATMGAHEALAFIQARILAPKDARNNFGGYNYRSAESILASVKPLLAETGATLTISDELFALDAQRVYIRATATLTGADGATLTATAFAREPLTRKGMDDAQCTGSSTSYARKYALCGLLAVDDSRGDPDAWNKHEEATPQKPLPATMKPVKTINPDAPSAKEITAKLCACENLDALRKATVELVRAGADKEKTYALGAQLAKEKGFNSQTKTETK